MNSIQLLLQMVIGVYSTFLLLRAWFQYCRVDYYNPLSQTIVKITQPVLGPIRRIIPTRKNIDFAALFMVFILGTIQAFLILNSMKEANLSLINYVIIGALSVIKQIGTILFWSIFLQAILSWFGQNQQLSVILYQMTNFALAPIRRFMPNTGMIHFSPMVLAFALIFINNILASSSLIGAYWSLA